MPYHRHAPIVLGLLFILVGLCVGTAGVWLMALGGSWYYLPAGLAWVLTGLMLAQRNPGALWVHAGLLIATLAWSLWEAGFDWWPLAARADVLFLLGLLLLTPWVSRGLMATGQPAPRRGLASALVLVGAVGMAAWFQDAQEIAGDVRAAPVPASGRLLVDGHGVSPDDRHAYGRTGAGERLSALPPNTQAHLRAQEVVWKHRTGELRGHNGSPEEPPFEVTPLKAGNRLVLCTPHQSVVALDATTGAEVWRHDRQMQGGLALQHLHCGGLAYHAGDGTAATGPVGRPAALPRLSLPLDGASLPPPRLVRTALATARGGAPALPPPAGACAARLFMPTADGRLLALNPHNGARCSDFGAGRGEIDLWTGMPHGQPGAGYATSPMVVTRNLVIVNGTALHDAATRGPADVIRAFDVHSGALVWHWTSGPPGAATPQVLDATITAHAPRSGSISHVDEALGLVYVPLGTPPPPLGGPRGAPVERYSSSVVALELGTGRARWHVQTVQHHLWDHHVPAQPTLVDLQLNGTTVPALVQPTAQGEVFVLDRRTGTPLLPATESAAHDGATPLPPRSALAFDAPRLTGADMWGVTMFDQLACRIAFERMRFEGRFTLPSTEGTLVQPGNVGVFNWSGVAGDPPRQGMLATPARLAFTAQRVPHPEGHTPLVQDHRGLRGVQPALNEHVGAPYAVRLRPFLSPLGLPCQAPPWGMTGAELTASTLRWKQRSGTGRGLAPVLRPLTEGVPSQGDPLTPARSVAGLSDTLKDTVHAQDGIPGDAL